MHLQLLTILANKKEQDNIDNYQKVKIKYFFYTKHIKTSLEFINNIYDSACIHSITKSKLSFETHKSLQILIKYNFRILSQIFSETKYQARIL